MVNEVLYCERLMYLEWAQGEFEDNAFTVEGRVTHRRADQPGGKMPPKPAEPDPDAPSTDERPYQARSVWVSSERLRLTAKIDIVEGEQSGRVIPIEYKRGAAPDLPGGAWPPERAQVCAQVLLLRDHGYAVDHGEIYFAASRKRVQIPIDDELVAITVRAIERAREVTAEGELPHPLVDSPKCDGCSLVGICLPDETNLLRRLAGEPPPEPRADDPNDEVGGGGIEPDPWGLAVDVPPRELRRLHPARDDRVPLYVQEQGARIGVDGDELAVSAKTGSTHVRIANTSQVCLLGNIQLTTQAARTLLERNVPVSYFSRGGWFYGRLVAHESKNVELRLAQYRAAIDPVFCVTFSRRLVASKIRNCRTLLRRNMDDADPVVLSELEQLAKKAEACDELSSLLGIEGTAARFYFRSFPSMLRGEAAKAGFDWEGRSRRPPADPINALVSFAYSMLTKDVTVAVGAVGLDPMLGFYHQPRFGRPALVLDLMEEFRPLLADSTVLGVLNTGVLDTDDFISHAGAASLKPHGRRKFLLAWERRLDQLVTHPVFGYRISYRRVLEVQARLLGRYLLGEVDEYPEFRTR